MEYKYEVCNGQLRIYVPKELDHHCARKLQREADLLIEAYQIDQLVFDFRNTEFMDSSGIGVLIGRSRNMKFFGGKVVAEHLSERVKKIFQISGLNHLIKVIGQEGLE